MAENQAFSKDLKSQAENLISRIKRSANADYREDWKVQIVSIKHRSGQYHTDRVNIMNTDCWMALMGISAK